MRSGNPTNPVEALAEPDLVTQSEREVRREQLRFVSIHIVEPCFIGYPAYTCFTRSLEQQPVILPRIP